MPPCCALKRSDSDVENEQEQPQQQQRRQQRRRGGEHGVRDVGEGGSGEAEAGDGRRGNPGGPAGAWRVEVQIPSGTAASVCVPLFGAALAEVVITLDGAPTTAGQLDAGGAYVCLGGLRQRAATVAVAVRL